MVIGRAGGRHAGKRLFVPGSWRAVQRNGRSKCLRRAIGRLRGVPYAWILLSGITLPCQAWKPSAAICGTAALTSSRAPADFTSPSSTSMLLIPSGQLNAALPASKRCNVTDAGQARAMVATFRKPTRATRQCWTSADQLPPSLRMPFRRTDEGVSLRPLTHAARSGKNIVVLCS